MPFLLFFVYLLLEEDNFQINISDFCSHLNDSIDLLVLCNPNNPTSTAITRKDMRKILDTCLQYGTCVMVDETYEEFAPLDSKISSIPLTNNYNNLIVLRGISKFFAAPGLRLGYAVTGNPDLLKYINTKKNPWTINSLAEIAGCIMFSDKEYIDKTRALISGEKLYPGRGQEYAEKIRDYTIALYKKCAEYALTKNIIIADTKFEFGLDENGDVVLGDEMLTPDSSRFWPLEGYKPGQGQPSFDKQYVRDWLKANPESDFLLPEEVINKTVEKYVEAYELLSGEKF